MAQGLDSMSTNNLTSPVTQCACMLVTPQRAHKALKLFTPVNDNLRVLKA